jgi:ligand-binding sensor domain-containing protein/DNA-binding response OmpR family regulator/signal transduction histidine kinase
MNRFFRTQSICLLLIFIITETAALPPDPFFIQHYDNRDGLSNSSINKLFNDADNLLWVATWDGLNMYDGSSFRVFNYSKENDFKSIGNNVIQNITEDKNGNIWISTIEGISRYEKRTGKFYNYFYKQYREGKVSEQEYSIAVDGAGTVYCLSQNSGLNYYDAASDTFRTCKLPQRKSKIIKITFDDANHLWLLNSNGQLDVCARDKNSFVLLYTFQEKKDIINLFVINHGVVFTTADDQLFSVNTGTLERKLVMQMPHSLNSIIFYKDHYLLGWASKGYGVFDNNFLPSTFLGAEAKQMRDVKITSWALGTEDILWFGTDGNGILKIYPKTKSFGTVTTSENGMPYNKSVRAFCEDNGNLWVGTKGSGIIVYQNFWATKSTSIKKQYFLAPEELDNNAVYALKKGNDDLIYIGTDGKGIGVYDQKNKKFNKWSSIKGNDAWPEFGSVYAIFQDTDNSLWLGTSGYGLIHLKINSDQKGNLSVTFLQKFTFNSSDTGPANDIIYSLTAGDENQLWIGCRYGGLSLLNKKTKKFKNFKAFTYEGSLSNNDVLSVFKDSRNRIWVGTSYGLNLINNSDALKREPVFQKLSTLNGLPNNTIHAIEEDRLQQIWVSTNKGIAKVDPGDLKVSYYQQSDGLQSNEFCDGAVWKDKSDNLFFGGTYGFNNFLPQNIHKTNWLPTLFISDISIGGKETKENGFVVMKDIGSKPLDFSISRKDNFFELNIKALSFLNADKCEYAWYLEGYDKVWHYAGTSGKIMYSNILPGNYVLKIKWSNGEGSWTKEMPLLTAEVKQYFWLTPYAFLVYALFASAIIYIIYKYRKNKLQAKHQLEVEHLLRAKEDEIHQNRLGFFTNIAHELQTPLTLIMGAAERFIEKPLNSKPNKERSYFLSLIHQQASKLTYLVHQLLEFRKGEAGFIENQYCYADITELLSNLANPFVTLSGQHEIHYELNINSNMTGMVDKDKVERIIFNLLSNAFKYSGKNEQIVFAANENKINKELEITVSNSGIELSAEQLSQLFDQFYVIKNNVKSDKFGTGIGLAFTRQLVTMLNGRINAFSEDGWISFKVFLPLPVEIKKVEVNKNMISDQPSYLYQTITSYSETDRPVSTKENNKDAILEDLLDENKKKVLVVEDEPEIRFLLKDILKDDYIVYEAEDGREALDLIDKVFPDIVICDIMMPNMNGLELCNKIKNNTATCEIPFILLTAKGSEEHRIEGYEAGADAYIPKPFNSKHLKVRIRKLLEYHQKLHDIFKSNSSADLLNETEMPEGDREFLTKLVQVIEEHLIDPELNAVFLEKSFCISKMQLYRKLKTLTGMTPGEFIKHIRLKHTARLLISTNLNVTEIFYQTGFNNQSYFFREFKKRYNCAPNEYREQNTVRK